MIGFVFERSVWKLSSIRSFCWIINWKERSTRRLCFFVLHWFMRKFLVAFDKREKFWDLVINVFWTVLQISAIYRQHRDISWCSNLGDIIVKNRSIYSSDFLHKKITKKSRYLKKSRVDGGKHRLSVGMIFICPFLAFFIFSSPVSFQQWIGLAES